MTKIRTAFILTLGLTAAAVSYGLRLRQSSGDIAERCPAGIRGRANDPLLSRSDRCAVLVGDAEERRARPRLRAGLRRRGADVRSAPAPAEGRARRAEDSVLPQSDGPARHLAGAEEGLDGDGLHRRL